MSNPTSNFGWQMPTPTDLVTDLPADFEVFGQAVDSSMADLKGGTTGQILSKATNTDMDFVWITNDQGDITGVTAGTGISGGGTSGTVTVTNSMATTMTTKGDLVPATGSGTFARLAAGNNGETLVADSSTSTGLRYQVGNGLAQGVINGGFDIWQRSTSTSGNGYTCTDRFYVYGSGTSTFSRESSVVPTGLQYSFKHLAGATTSSSLAQVIETSNAILYAGQTVTLSMYASASTATTMSLQLAYSTGTDTGIGGSWTDITATGSATFAAGTGGTFTRGSAIFAVPSTAKSLRVTLAVSGTIANTVAVYYAGAQLEVGSVATQFRRAGGSIQGELAVCQRYYIRYAVNGNPTSFARGLAVSTTSMDFNIPLPVTLRSTLQTIDGSNLRVSVYGTNDYSSGTFTTAYSGPYGSPVVSYTHGSAVFTQNQAGTLNTTTGYLGLSAEL